MKRSLSIFCVICLMIAVTPITMAQAQQYGFTQQQFKDLLNENRLPLLRQTTVVGDTFYAIDDNNIIYSWCVGDINIQKYCSLPEPPPESLIQSYRDLSSANKSLMDDTVTHLFGGDNKLWGVNLYSGRVGEITAERIQWKNVAFDNSQLWNGQQPVTEIRLQGFVESGLLYMLREQLLVAWDIENDIQSDILLSLQAYQMYAYKEGQALILAFENSQIQNGYAQALYSMDLHNGVTTPLPIALATFELDEPGSHIDMNGLAYDVIEDTIYYRAMNINMRDHGMLCRSLQGEPFKKAEVLSAYGKSFALPGKRYAINDMDNKLTVYEVTGLAEMKKTELIIKGMWGGVDHKIQAYLQLKPEMIIRNQITNLGDDDITAILTGDSTVDIYAIFANQLYRRAADKGYAADLSGDKIVSAAVKSMHPAMQRALHNKSGQLSAFPSEFMSLSLWQVDKQIWQACFGDRPYPETFKECFEVMSEWELDFSDDYDGINVYGFFDMHVLLWEMIYQYIANYETPEKPIDFNTPIFQEALSAYKLMVKTIDMPRFVQNNSDGAASLFSGGGLLVEGNSLLFNPQVSGVALTSPLSFEKGTPSQIQANIVLLMVNARSLHVPEAIDFISYLSHKEDTDMVFQYAIYSNQEGTAENPVYNSKMEKLAKKHTQFLDAMEKVEKSDRPGFEAQISIIEADMAELEHNRFIITQEGVERYRSWADCLLFTDDSLYISQNDMKNPFYRNVLSLCKQFVDGKINEEEFISSLSSISRVIFYENQ